MTSCLSELKVTPSFCFPFKIPDDPTATTSHSFAMAKYFFQSERFEFSIFCKSKMENVPFIDFTDNRTVIDRPPCRFSILRRLFLGFSQPYKPVILFDCLSVFELV